MAYTTTALLGDIRAIQRKNIHGMGEEGRAGVSPYILYGEVSQRATRKKLLGLLHELRASNQILIVGRKTRPGSGMHVIEFPLDEAFFGCGACEVGEETFYPVRIYVIADGLPKSLARQGVIKRALARLTAQA